MADELAHFNPLYYSKTLEEFEKHYSVLNTVSVHYTPKTYNGWICYREIHDITCKVELVKDPNHLRHRINGPAVFTFDTIKNNSLIEVAYYHEDDYLLSLPCSTEEYKKKLLWHPVLNNILAAETVEFLLSK